MASTSFTKIWEAENLWKMGLIVCFVLNTWAVSNFASKKDFNDLVDRTYKIEGLLGQMQVKSEVDGRQDTRLSQLEGRVRQNELDIVAIEDKTPHIKE